MQLAQSLTVLGTGLLAGIFLMGSVAIRPAAAALEPDAHLLLRQQLIRRRAFMPWLMVFTVAASAASTVALWPSLVPVQRFAQVVVVLLALTTLGITLAVNVPLNRRFLRWTVTTIPSDWQALVRRWDTADTIRLMVALLAFGCALVAGR